MALSRKHYIELAKLFGTALADEKIDPTVVGGLMDFLARDNPRFSYGTFRNAVETAETKRKYAILKETGVKYPFPFDVVSFEQQMRDITAQWARDSY